MSGRRDPRVVEEIASQLLDYARRFFKAIEAQENIIGTPLEGTVAIEVPVLPEGTNQDKERAVSELVSKTREHIKSLIQSHSNFRLGAIYCFLCNSLDCPHARPMENDQCFRGFSSAGRPQWQKLCDILLERKDPRVEQVFGLQKGIVCILERDEDFPAEFVTFFKKDEFEVAVLGQVIVSPVVFQDASKRGGQTDRTLSIILMRLSSSHHARYYLNMLGIDMLSLSQIAATDQNALRLLRTMQAYQRQIALKNRRRVNKYLPYSLEQERTFFASLLSRLKCDIEQIFHASERRTRHGEERHKSMQRPTANAFRDVKLAGADRFLLDKEHNTVVVLGPKGRAHVFTRDGKLVTSMVLDRQGIERRFSRKRWVSMSKEEVSRFKEGMEQ